VIDFDTATARANGVPVVHSPAHRLERVIRLGFAHAENSLEAESAGGGGKKEMLCHVIVSGDNMHKI
jgi:hypothetical protein